MFSLNTNTKISKITVKPKNTVFLSAILQKRCIVGLLVTQMLMNIGISSALSEFDSTTINSSVSGSTTVSIIRIASETNTNEDPVSFVGIKKSRTAEILDTFKEGQMELLFKNSPFTPEEER
jgi:hypothetical protein